MHIALNTAGIPQPFKLLDKQGRATNLNRFSQVIGVNLIGTYNVMGQCAEAMQKNPIEKGERGVLINVSSVAAFEGQVGASAYSASKAGVNGLNMPLARELGEIGIRVNSIAPGMFNTPMAKSLDEKVLNSLIRQCEAPKRMGEPREFAHACAFLIENGYMNGRVLRLDAATVLQAKGNQG